MQTTLSIRYAFCACAYGVLCYLEPSIVFKAKVARHVRTRHSHSLRNHVRLQSHVAIRIIHSRHPTKPRQNHVKSK